MNGSIVQQFVIQNQPQQQVSGLPAVAGLVKLASENTVQQKVIMQ